jgi:hypothetical protein
MIPQIKTSEESRHFTPSPQKGTKKTYEIFLIAFELSSPPAAAGVRAGSRAGSFLARGPARARAPLGSDWRLRNFRDMLLNTALLRPWFLPESSLCDFISRPLLEI